MNLPNSLTLLRLGITVFFVASLTLVYPWHATVALALFLLATLTDYLDGEIARRKNLITDFGKLMDPLADKVLTASAFICLIPLIPNGALPAWTVIIIISREFLITGLRLLASSKGIILPAEKLGKHKTAWQMAAIIFFLVQLSVGEFFPDSPSTFSTIWSYGGSGFVTITVALTIFSGLAYFWKNRSLLTEE
jgi:CDP-diacylglycerol---glycerol-3-phosphate 3-phosphatidyltransferase